MIGFDSLTYRVSEDAITVTLTVVLISGRLDSEVTVEFFTSQGTAVGRH